MTLVQFPRIDDPIVSVVVLAWRQTDRLVDCLVALQASVDAPPFEVVLVLNGADPEVRTVVETEISGAVVVDIEQNLGFGGGCNVGISTSRGAYVLLLNDDVTVDEKLLATLVNRVTTDPSIAAAAAVLINPDGSLQEAGSRVLSGGGTAQLGAGLAIDSDAAQELLVVRDIDYGSAAALLIARTALDAIGGFDPIYEPAYFEDVDLALRLKERGLRVVLEPAARAVHATGSSTATDTRFRRFASDHAGTEFAARWGHLFPNAADSDAAPEVVLPVPRAERAPVQTSTQLPIATSASIATNYSAWLSTQLDEREAQHETDETALAAARAEVERLNEHVESLNATAHGLKVRLDDLESRSPIGVVKWQLGLAKLRHKR